MNSRTAILLGVVALILASVPAIKASPLSFELPSMPDIGGGLFSTGRIIAKMCNSENVNDEVAQKYYDCYGESPYDTKGIFETCQKSAYGYLLNSADNWKLACRAVTSLPSYVSCLRSGFKDAGVDLEKAMENVNKCEAKVLGMD